MHSLNLDDCRFLRQQQYITWFLYGIETELTKMDKLFKVIKDNRSGKNNIIVNPTRRSHNPTIFDDPKSQ